MLLLNTSTCNWILYFLTGRPQTVQIGSTSLSTIILSTGAPQGCVLGSLFFTLLTHDCTSSSSTNYIIKWREWRAPNSFVFTSQKTFPGLPATQQRLHFLRWLRNMQLPKLLLTTDGGKTPRASWASAWQSDKETLQKIVRTAVHFIGSSLPNMLHIRNAGGLTDSTRNVKDPLHHCNRVPSLPSLQHQ